MQSYYLDDMILAVGQQVRCKCNLAAEWFDIGRIYMYCGGNKLMSSDGSIYENPSARFQYVS